MAPDASYDALLERWQELDREHARVLAVLDRSLKKHGISACELGILQRLAAQVDHEVNIQDLCDCAQRSQSAISRIVGRLEAQGLLARATPDADRRRVSLSLTAAGHKRLRAAETTQRQALTETMA